MKLPKGSYAYQTPFKRYPLGYFSDIYQVVGHCVNDIVWVYKTDADTCDSWNLTYAHVSWLTGEARELADALISEINDSK